MAVFGNLRTSVALALLATSMAVATLAPWVPLAASHRGPDLALATCCSALLALAAVSSRPGLGLVGLGAVLAVFLFSAPIALFPFPLAFGALYGAAASEVARLASKIRRERPLRSVNDAAIGSAGILIVGTAPSALFVGDAGCTRLLAMGVGVGTVALALQLRGALWLQRATRGAERHFELRLEDGACGLPTWSALAPDTTRTVVLSKSHGNAAYRSSSAPDALAVITRPGSEDAARWIPWKYVLGAGCAAIAWAFVLAVTCHPHGCREPLTKTALGNAREIRNAVQRYRGLHPAGGCPTVVDLVRAGEIDDASRTDDPWGSEYRIDCAGSDATVTSSGPDKRVGTADDIVVPK